MTSKGLWLEECRGEACVGKPTVEAEVDWLRSKWIEAEAELARRCWFFMTLVKEWGRVGVWRWRAASAPAAERNFHARRERGVEVAQDRKRRRLPRSRKGKPAQRCPALPSVGQC